MVLILDWPFVSYHSGQGVCCVVLDAVLDA